MSTRGPNWEGLLRWSLSHSDGTHPTRNVSVEDRRWFMEAMQDQTVDVINRMKEITLMMQTPQQVLESQGVTPQDIEGLLDELQDHVECIDMANGLHSVGGLLPLLTYLKNSHPNIKAKAAEVVSTIVQNNQRSQKLVMEANGLQLLLPNFISDPDVNVRTKALGAISSLIRHNKPGIAAFRLSNGFVALKDALSSDSVRFQRKTLTLIHYLLNVNISDCNIFAELGFTRNFMHLASSRDSGVREAALTNLLELAKQKPDNNNPTEEKEDKLKPILQERIIQISNMSPEDLQAAEEERQLVDTLWSVLYNEPSSLRGIELSVDLIEDINVDDAVQSDVIGAWAANTDQIAKPSNEKKEAPLLLGP